MVYMDTNKVFEEMNNMLWAEENMYMIITDKDRDTPPHPKAVWRKYYNAFWRYVMNAWFIELNSLEDLWEFADATNSRVVIGTDYGGFRFINVIPHGRVRY